jgi:diguanylate cyclase (GGDEF)-like protein
MEKPSPRPDVLPLLYVLVILPWIAEYLVRGQGPAAAVVWIAQSGLSILIGAGVFILLDFHRRLRQQRDEIERLSGIDALTLVGHPRALEEALVKEIARARRMVRPLSCIFFDLDDFKKINDRFGYDTGNSVLQTVGKTMRGAIRQGVDMAFRYGGDEFVIILPEADKAKATLIAKRLHRAISSLHPPAIPLKTLEASLAVAQLRPEQIAMDLLNLVDKAAHLAKTRGKNSIIDAEELEKDLQL